MGNAHIDVVDTAARAPSSAGDKSSPELVLELLREGDGFALYRRPESDGPALLALCVAEDAPDPQGAERLAHEYALATELDLAWAAKPLSLTRSGGRSMLLLEDPGGEPLDRLLLRAHADAPPPDLTRMLSVAVNLAGCLAAVHERGIIHKDMKPAHVLVDDAGRTHVLGFGIASRLRRERHAPGAAEVIAGTLAYMAPEQTGRMNRSVDARSDLYSFGVTLYEMLTGSLPFTAADAHEWIHCHIARTPLPPSARRPEIPAALDRIVLKLLAKNAEDRYQTAAGVEADLRACLAALNEQRDVGDLELGRRDTPRHLLVPERLYGREAEIDALLAAFDRVVDRGGIEFVLVSGYAGVGKSSVVNELHQALVPSRGLFAAGKFDQYKHDIPYATLAEAIQTLVRQLLTKEHAELARWRDELVSALGPNAELMVTLVPELALVIGEQPPSPPVAPQDMQARFHAVFKKLLGVFARAEHPLVLFVDDLQWLDGATLDLLRSLVSDPESRHLLLIGAYRAKEVNAEHPLSKTLAAIREAGGSVSEVILDALETPHVAQLTADALHTDVSRVSELAELVQQKTDGNPFFVIQFISALEDEGLVTFDASDAAWRWDTARIRAKNITDNVATLMVQRLARFPEDTLRIVGELACLGNKADAATLSMSLATPVDDVHGALWEVVRAGLVVRQDDTYTFLHDRVHEAAYALVPGDERAAAHLRIARRLVAASTDAETDERLFDVVSQFNRGASLVSDVDERTQVAELNLRAARKAKASAAYGTACVFLATGAELLGADCWTRCPALAFSLTLERAECSFLNGDFALVARLIDTLLEQSAAKVDMASVYRLKIELHVVRSENSQAVASALAGLRLFGIDARPRPEWSVVEREYEMIWQEMNGRTIESLGELPAMTDPEVAAVMRVIAEVIAPAYFTDYNLYALLICRMVNLTLRHGATDSAIHGYAWFAQLLGPTFGQYADGYRMGLLAYSQAAKRHGPISLGRAEHMVGLLAWWTRPLTTSIDWFRQSFRTGVAAGDLFFSSYAGAHIAIGSLMRGDPLSQVAAECDEFLQFARKINFTDIVDVLRSIERVTACLRGSTRGLSDISDAEFDGAAFEAALGGDRMAVLANWHWTRKTMLHFLAGEYEATVEAADRAEPASGITLLHVQNFDGHFYAALALAALVDAMPSEKREQSRARLMTHYGRLHEWAVAAGAPTSLEKDALVAAEIARVDGRELEAMRLYEDAIRLAREHGFIHNEALANELAARFYASRGFDTIADTYLRAARAAYDRWGAVAKVKQLDARFPQLRPASSGVSRGSTISAAIAQLDADTVVRASQTLSSEMVLPRLIEKLMRLAVEHAGADRGVLILTNDEGPHIEAEATSRGGAMEVAVRQAPVTPASVPHAVLQLALRTRRRVARDDATDARGDVAVDDEYMRAHHPRSLVCLPILKQTEVIGALYLENSLSARAFTADRVATLDYIAAQAAISLENARLYSDLRRSEAMLSEAQHLSETGSFLWRVATDEFVWSAQNHRIFELHPSMPVTLGAIASRMHEEDRPTCEQTLQRARETGGDLDCEYRLRLPGGAVKHVHMRAHATRDKEGALEYVGAVQDVSRQRRSDDAIGKLQSELAHVARVTSLGVLTASIAHEVNQPLAALLTNAGTCLRMLAANPPDVQGAIERTQRTIRSGQRASDVIARLRALFAKDGAPSDLVDLNEAAREVIALSMSELQRSGITVRTELADDLPEVAADRVQLQQVLLNLILNARDAMDGIEGRPRVVVVRTYKESAETVGLAVQDSGVGLDAQSLAKLFDAFFTTKPDGMGIGLSVSRSIIERHGGRLWAEANEGPDGGATFCFTIPRDPQASPESPPVHDQAVDAPRNAILS